MKKDNLLKSYEKIIYDRMIHIKDGYTFFLSFLLLNLETYLLITLSSSNR